VTTRFKPPPEPRSKTKSEETPNPIAKSPYLHEHVLTSTAALILGRTRGLRVLIYFNVFNHFGELYPVHPRLRFGRKSSTRLNLQHPETYNDIEGHFGAARTKNFRKDENQSIHCRSAPYGFYIGLPIHQGRKWDHSGEIVTRTKQFSENTPKLKATTPGRIKTNIY